MKANPRKIPRTEADCRKAFDEGVKEGSGLTSVIFLTVLCDHFGFDQLKAMKCYQHVMKLSEEIVEKRVKISDLKHVLLTEYGIDA